jgi:hypothetical protein
LTGKPATDEKAGNKRKKESVRNKIKSRKRLKKNKVREESEKEEEDEDKGETEATIAKDSAADTDPAAEGQVSDFNEDDDGHAQEKLSSLSSDARPAMLDTEPFDKDSATPQVRRMYEELVHLRETVRRSKMTEASGVGHTPQAVTAPVPAPPPRLSPSQEQPPRLPPSQEQASVLEAILDEEKRKAAKAFLLALREENERLKYELEQQRQENEELRRRAADSS